MSGLKDFKSMEERFHQAFAQGLAKALGFTFNRVLEDGIEAKVTVAEMHARSGGIANGGLALAALETVGSITAMSQIDIEKYNIFGTAVSMNHLRAAKVGETLIVRSKAVHVGRSTHVWDVELFNEEQQMTSSGRITMIVIPRK